MRKIHKKGWERIADEAVIDCYDRYEQISGWCAYLEDVMDLPCRYKTD